MRDLDGRFAGFRIAVKGEQTVLAEGFDHGLHRVFLFAAYGYQFSPMSAPPGIFGAFTQTYQPHKELARGFFVGSLHPLVDFFGAASQRTQHTAAVAVGVQCQSL